MSGVLGQSCGSSGISLWSGKEGHHPLGTETSGVDTQRRAEGRGGEGTV